MVKSLGMCQFSLLAKGAMTYLVCLILFSRVLKRAGSKLTVDCFTVPDQDDCWCHQRMRGE